MVNIYNIPCYIEVQPLDQIMEHASVKEDFVLVDISAATNENEDGPSLRSGSGPLASRMNSLTRWDTESAIGIASSLNNSTVNLEVPTGGKMPQSNSAAHLFIHPSAVQPQDEDRNAVQRSRSLSQPHALQEPDLLLDPGNHSQSHFAPPFMSPVRFWLRELLVPFTATQSAPLARWQSYFRTPMRDAYFAYTALLGSHTFYVLCLPMPVWFGGFEHTRDLVYLLGYSIYLSGFLKDYLCLPRPRAPPLKRITLSAYTAKEYGAPSSHTANATAVALFLLWSVAQNSNYLSAPTKIMLVMLITMYYFTLVLGRLYCGMHGFLDLFSGTLIGIVCFLGRIVAKSWFKDFNCGSHWWYPIISITWGLGILLNHVRPIDECPCFADSVAFIGVVTGIEVCDWIIKFIGTWPLVYAFQFSSEYALGTLANLIIGVIIVIIWKYGISKPLVYSFLKLVMNDDRDTKREIWESYSSNLNECSPYIGEPLIDIFGRFIIYAGIPLSVMIISPIASSMLNIL